jgi:hypothetical protein
MRIWPKAAFRLNVGAATLVAAAVIVLVLIKQWPLWALAVGPAAGAMYYMIAMRRYVRRRAMTKQPFPAEWQKILHKRVPFYRQLTDPEARARFENDVRFFIAEQNIYGPRGEPVSDEDRLLVGASAAVLGHGLPDWEWPNLRDIVVYKKAFSEEYEEGDREHIIGMVHSQGPIIFSEKHLKHGFKGARDGVNVGLHELAHVMDMADGAADGVPMGLDWMANAPWVEALAARLCKHCAHRHQRVLNTYAYTNEAEFFAVAVETFFERPKTLKRKDPELYALLADYFNQDPAAS